VPAGQRGRWMGITNTFSSLLRIPAPIIGGLIYKSANPGVLFLITLLIDMGLRMPVLIFKVPETTDLVHA
jgi:hypothetical protein